MDKRMEEPGGLARAGLALAAVVAGGVPALAQLPRLHSFYGDRPGERLGVSVAAAGDVDRDGHGDFIVGATDGNGYPPLSDFGEAHVLSGLDGSVLFTFRADEVATAFGNAVCGAGDVNGDGWPDVAVGARYDKTSEVYAGAVYVYSGRDGSLLHAFFGDDEGDRLGYSVAGAGDVNGDGFDDVIAGAIFDSNNGFWSGSARVFSGRTGAILHHFDGDAQYDQFGTSVAGAGDVDGDGRPDLIVGAAHNDAATWNAGLARVFSGRDGSVLHTFFGLGEQDLFGISVGAAGDVDGDGRADLIVGASVADGVAADAGTATVFSGRDGSVLYAFLGENPNDHFGYSVAGAGDFDGDSGPDLIVGAYFDDSGRGSASLFSGADGSLLMTLVGDADDDFFGLSVAGAGDANGDGLADVIVGATASDVGGQNAGSAHVWAGLEFARTYCTAKPGLACGLPAIRFAGQASASATSGFTVAAGPALGGRSGILLYSNAGPAAIAFQGGTLCAASPLRRGPLLGSGGTPGQCGAEFSLDLNAFAAGQAGGSPAPFLSVPGTLVHCQWWGRDTPATGSFLSDALVYVVRP